jgi:hypothetical protein
MLFILLIINCNVAHQDKDLVGEERIHNTRSRGEARLGRVGQQAKHGRIRVDHAEHQGDTQDM